MGCREREIGEGWLCLPWVGSALATQAQHLPVFRLLCMLNVSRILSLFQRSAVGPPPGPNPGRSAGLGVVEALPLFRPELPLSCHFSRPGEKLPPSIQGGSRGGDVVGSLRHPADLGQADPPPSSALSATNSGQRGQRWGWGAGGKNRKEMRGLQPSGSLNVSAPWGEVEATQGTQDCAWRLCPPLPSGQRRRVGGLVLLGTGSPCC